MGRPTPVKGAMRPPVERRSHFALFPRGSEFDPRRLVISTVPSKHRKSPAHPSYVRAPARATRQGSATAVRLYVDAGGDSGCGRRDLNPHETSPQEPKSCVSAARLDRNAYAYLGQWPPGRASSI
jgi:hypothetical protein